jgi:hypothetical protein
VACFIGEFLPPFLVRVFAQKANEQAESEPRAVATSQGINSKSDRFANRQITKEEWLAGRYRSWF